MLTTLAGSVITSLASTFIGKALDAFVAYQNKQITLAELNVRVQQAMMDSFKEIEKAHAEALAKTFESFMVQLGKSKLLQVVWGAVVISQLLVLIWHQIGIPALVYFAGVRYPSSGSTVEWAYAVVLGGIGLGPIVLNRNAAGTTMADKLKSLIGR